MNNRNMRPDPNAFRVHIEDDDFDNPQDTLDSLNGTQRINLKPDVLDENRDLNPYDNDKKEKSAKREHKKRDKIKSHKNRRIFRIVWVFMVALMALTLGGYLVGGANDFLAADRSEGTTTVEVPDNVTSEELADLLYQSGAINKPEFFQLYCTITTKMEYFSKGTFNLDTNMDYEAIINTLQAGDSSEQETVEITFQEGMTVREIAQKLEDNGVCSAEDFLNACNSSDYDKYDMIGSITNASDRYYKLEGYLFPDTYTFYKNDEIESVVGKFLYNYQTRVTSDIVDDINNSNYTMDQVITIASIIQAEAANTDDMYIISAIIRNRLENPSYEDIYTLGMDSTIYYPYSDASDAPEGFSSNYNTYNFGGLPAGPICNPGIDAIKAAVRPNTSKGGSYYYFCHSADGTPYYAETAWEHENNLVEAGLAG